MVSPTPSHVGYCLLLVAYLVTRPIAVAQDKDHPGKRIYMEMCAECHGNDGQGVDGKYDEPLVGERSVQALTRYIEKNMPEDKEGTCVGQDAKDVTTYIYDAFYSPAAQERLNPPSIDLSRLTTPQFRNSVMDIVARFPLPLPAEPNKPTPKPRPPQASEPGLKATYRGVGIPKPGEKPVEVAKKGIKKKPTNAVLARVEPHVSAHFGEGSPDPATMEAEQFNNRWDGAVFAADTGVYEFLIKTENGARLWINDTDEADALIDAWVSAGPQVREERKAIFLLGGRSYRLVLEHFKFKEKTSSIELWWKPPHGTLEIIPQRVLSTARPAERLVVATPFPADDRSAGYERGTTISKDWDQAVTDAAILTAEWVTENIDLLTRLKPEDVERARNRRDGFPGPFTKLDRPVAIREFASEFATAAFRRPLTPEQRAACVDTHFSQARTPELALKRVVLQVLKSAQFLYPDLHGRIQKPDDYDVASKMALGLWDSLPDQDLVDAATAGALHTRDQVRAQAQRMLADERAREKMRGFFHQWLDFERAESTAKDPKVFPEFNDEMIADLRESLLRFIDGVVWSEKSDYRELLQADYLLLNERLGRYYGKPVAGDEFQPVAFDPKQRSGIVTHPYLLAAMAYSKQSSPIHRGVFLSRNIVGMSLKPPVKAVVFEDSHFNPKLTMREKITELTRSDACMHCHSMINPLGFSLENFDAVGRWRTKDNNKPVNPVGEFSNDEGKRVKLTGPRDIANYVASNPSGHRAFIRHLFNHLVKQSVTAYGPKTLDELQKGFAASQCNIQKLIVEIAVVSTQVKE